jgi:hypothetical protein
MEMMSEVMLTKGHLKEEEFFVRSNYIFTFEDWLPLFNPIEYTFFDV